MRIDSLGYSVSALRAFGGALALTLLVSGPAHAQADVPSPAAAPPLRASVISGDPPSLKMVRIDPSEAPVIDGDVSDPIWQKAPTVDGLLTSSPVSGQPGSERTVMRILYDSQNLYIHIYAYDDPSLITLPSRTRDAIIGSGDFVRIFIDPLQTRRNGYAFDIGPRGGKADLLVQNSKDNIVEWNSIWTARSRIVADGWTAELAIPFRNLAYDPNREQWGFDFYRIIRRKNERQRWGTINPAVSPMEMSQTGTLTGITDLDSGLGLDVQLYATARYKQDWQNPKRGSPSGSLSGNLYYRITPSLTGTVTVNPDFSDMPLDERQVNTSRFALFLPETRDFFLQDATAFEFGGDAFAGQPNARPFFTRNIGSINGRPVSILGGAKLSGTQGRLSIGALSVLTNEKEGTPGQILSAARMTANLSDTLTLGGIFTNGDPTGLTRNNVAGVDLRYFDTEFNGNQTIQSDLYYETSASSAHGHDSAFGASVSLPNEPWGGYFRFKQVGADFAPALGFVNRAAIREYEVAGILRVRSATAFYRSLEITPRVYYVTDLQDRLETREFDLNATLVAFDGTQHYLRVVNHAENVTSAFNLPRGIPITPGRYDWTNVSARFETLRSRLVSILFVAECCSYYDGDYFRSDLTIRFRFEDYLQINPRYVGTYISTPAGNVDIHVLSLDTMMNITPDMQLALQAQYDNISRAFGLSVRYLWEYEPGETLFVAFGQSGNVPGLEFPGSRFLPQRSQLAVRLGTTMRY